MSWPRWLDPAPHWLWWLPASAMAIFLAAALAIPTFGYSDGEVSTVSASDRDDLRQTIDWLKFRPLWRQVVKAHPAEGAESGVEGVVVGRTLFGVEVVRLWHEEAVSPARSETNYRAGFLALTIFAAGIILLGAVTLVAAWKSE